MRCWSWKPDAPFLSFPASNCLLSFPQRKRHTEDETVSLYRSGHPLTNDFKSPIFCRRKHCMVNKQQRAATARKVDAAQKNSRFAGLYGDSSDSHTLGLTIVDVPGQGFSHDMRCMASQCAGACKVVTQGGPIVRMDAVLDNQRRTFTRRQSA